MIPLPSTGSMQLGSTMEPAEPVAIVRNFNKGLMQVRSTVLPLAPPFVVRKPIRVRLRERGYASPHFCIRQLPLWSFPYRSCFRDGL